MWSDQGAWFAYSLPDDKNDFCGFSGPFLMTQQNGVWISPCLTQLVVEQSNAKINWKSYKSDSYSSHLEQSFINDDIQLNQSLVFISGHSASIKSVITNIGATEKTLTYHWKNQEIFADSLNLSLHTNEIIISSQKSNALGHLLFPSGTKLVLDANNFSSIKENVTLRPNESLELVLTHTFIFPEYSWEKEQDILLNTAFDNILKQRINEKNKHFNLLLKNRKSQFQDAKYETVLAKSLLTLQNNWRIPAGELKHAGLFPSYHYKWFNGFWSWDSWKHSVGLSFYDTELAKNQLRALFDFQSEDGFIVDCIFRDTTIERHNYRDTKPPLSAWAVVEIFKKDKDLNFVKEMYPKLKKYHEWWYVKRDHDMDGLCEYGSTDGSLIAAKWESGMDNAIRFDDSKIMKNEEGAYSLDQESIDLNAYLYAEKLYLSFLAESLSKKDANHYKEQATKLKNLIQQQFYDSEDGWFYDTNLDGSSFIKGQGSEGWIPLWANTATKKQAETVKDKMMNTDKFFTKVPFQTMSADHPKFDPYNGYWRGPNWLDQAYFGVKGLRNYGYHEEADIATIKILNGGVGILDKGKSIRENYHPITGEGLNAENFSWSAAHIIMLLMEE
jgi:putative isomerase